MLLGAKEQKPLTVPRIPHFRDALTACLLGQVKMLSAPSSFLITLGAILVGAT